MELIDNYGTSKIDEQRICTIELGKEVPDQYWHCLLLPQSATRKQRVEAILRLAAELMITESLKEQTNNPRTTENNIPIELARTLRSLGYAIGYLVNCQSWTDGELQDFDRSTLYNRLIKASVL